MVTGRLVYNLAVLPQKDTFVTCKNFKLFYKLNTFYLFRMHNVFIIGKGTKPYVSLPRGNGIKLSIAEERDKRLAAKGAN